MIDPWINARLSPDGTVKDVRGDHVGRYQWAATRAKGLVLDAGCNSGYGTAILADAGFMVEGIDCWREGLEWASEHYDRPNIKYTLGDLRDLGAVPLYSHTVVAFEVIEHLANPELFLRQARTFAHTLLASVPNEDVWAWQPRLAPVHHRHYTKDDFRALLLRCGWNPEQWYGQVGGSSPVEPDVNGRTIVVECR